MKSKDFKILLQRCIESEYTTDNIWFVYSAFLDLTERQIEHLRQALRVSPICTYDARTAAVTLPNGLILKKGTQEYNLYVNSYYHHTFDAWNDNEALEYAKKKSRVYGFNYKCTVYKCGRLFAECYCGNGFLYKKGGV